MAWTGGPEPRLVLVSGYPPSTAFGGGLILRGLLAAYPADRLTVITNERVIQSLAERGDGGGLLAARHVGIHPWQSGRPVIRRMLRSLNALKVFTAARTIAAAVGSDGVVLAVPWGGELGSELFAAAYLAHRLTRAPLVVYEMDEWRASLGAQSGRVTRLLERSLHRRIVREASTVWAMNGWLADTLRERFGAQPRILPHAIDLSAFPARPLASSRGPGFRIVYTGAIYRAQSGAIANVARALEQVPGGELVLYTAETAEDLAPLGVHGSTVTIRRPVPLAEIPGVLQAADALLLPFSFDEDQRSVVSTSLPTKTTDYLASGVPILVHAPPYATVSRLAQAEGWALVVDQPSVEGVVPALARLAADSRLREELVNRALTLARERHDLGARRQEFLESIRAALDRTV